MKKKLRALFGTSALAAMFVAAPVFAAQIDVVGDNFLTGADSFNENEHRIRDRASTRLRNDVDVQNLADAWANTGHNDQERNTEGGSLETGSVDVFTDWENLLGDDALFFDEDGLLDISVDFLNDTTGADSFNRNRLRLDNNSRLNVDNLARVLNCLRLNANTGYDDQERNTLAGDLETGDIIVDSLITNEVNGGDFDGWYGDGGTVDVIGGNSFTGYNSDNINDVRIRNNDSARIRNRADIDNYVDVRANTGNNDQKRNTIAGDLETGDIEVSTDIVNVVNNAKGLLGGDRSTDIFADLSNDTTGADSDNRNDVDIDNRSTTRVDNRVDIDNELRVDANTGDNEQERNTESGDIVTGDVLIDFSVTNEVNGG